MDWTEVKGKWNQVKGEAKNRWGKLTDDDLMQVDGEKDRLVGKIQEAYGVAKEDAQRQVEEFERQRTW